MEEIMRKSFRFTSFLCVAALAMTGGAAHAGWKVVSRMSDRQKVSVDDSSIQKTGLLINLWTKVTPPPALSGTDAAANIVSQQTSPDYADGLPYLMQVSCGDKLIRLSAAAQTSTQPNPFGPSNTSPYTFQPLNNPVAYAVYSAACNSAPASQSAAPKVVWDDPRLITPRRTAPSRNPWPYTSTPGH